MTSRWFRPFDIVLLALVVMSIYRILPAADRSAFTRLPPPASTGKMLTLPGVTWTSAGRHVVIRVRTNCPVSEKSAEFYSRLSHWLRNNPKAGHLIIVSSEGTRLMSEWLVAKEIVGASVVEVGDPIQYGFLLIPTMLFVDSAGRITDTLVEQIDPLLQESVWQRLRGTRTMPIDTGDFAPEFFGAPAPDIVRLDVADRGLRASLPDGIHIPADELATRGPAELPRDRRIAVMCTQANAFRCRLSARQLRRSGFSQVSVAFSE